MDTIVSIDCLPQNFDLLALFDGSQAELGCTSDYVVTFDDHDGLGLLRMTSELNHAAIAGSVGDVILHAGAVSRADGGCAIMCGPSGSGKSTLTARLVARDTFYVTDEVVRLHPITLRLQGFRKPIVLKPGSDLALARRPNILLDENVLASGDCWIVPPSALGGAARPDVALWPKALVFPTFTAGIGCNVEQIAPAEAAFLLAANASRLRDVVPEPLAALARLARRAPAFRVVHDDVEHAAAVVLDLLASP